MEKEEKKGNREKRRIVKTESGLIYTISAIN
jgi:hypothetical protein